MDVDDIKKVWSEEFPQEQVHSESEYGNITRDEFEKELIKKYHFKATKDTEELYYYDSANGIYVKGGEWIIKQESLKFNPGINPSVVDQIIQHIKWGNYIDRSQFDSNIEWLACKNVVVNLLTGETKDHSPDFMAIVQIPHNFPMYPCCIPAKILKFFHQVMSSDNIETVLDFMAYCLWRSFPFHRWLLLNGSGRNGKGVTTGLIERLLGNKNVSNETLHRILDNKYASANLFGKMANIDADLSNEGLKRTGILKKLTGGDSIQGEFKFRDAFHFTNYAKPIFAVNKMPETPDETDAFFARPLIVNFPNQFIGENANPNLINELTTEQEMSALFGLLVRRVTKVLENGIFYTDTIEQNYEKYMRSSNPIRSFAESAIRKDNSADANIKIDKMYDEYIEFCDYYKLSKETDFAFSRDLGKLGFKKKQVRVGKGKANIKWMWISVKLIDWKNEGSEYDEDEEQGLFDYEQDL